MARVKICQTQATQSDRSLDITDSDGNADRSTRKTRGPTVFFFWPAFVFFGPAFFAAGFFGLDFLGLGFWAAFFFTALGARFCDRVAMLQVYQNWTLPYVLTTWRWPIKGNPDGFSTAWDL